MHIYNLLYYFQIGCFFLSFILSICTIGNKKVPPYMRWFFIYSFVAFIGLTTINILTINSDFNRNLVLTITLFSVVFHYIFLSVFFYKVILTKRSRLIFLSIFFFSIPFILLVLYNNFSQFGSMESFSVINFFLLIFCILYYNQLFSSLPQHIIFQMPSFWVASGVFFSMGMLIPVYSVFRYFITDYIEKEIRELSYVGFFAYGTMHLFFTKAYICSLTTKKI
jgi:hypothetical protein